MIPSYRGFFKKHSAYFNFEWIILLSMYVSICVYLFLLSPSTVLLNEILQAESYGSNLKHYFFFGNNSNMPTEKWSLPFSALPIQCSQCLSCVKQSIEVILLITVLAVPAFHHGEGCNCAKCFKQNATSFSVMITLHSNQMFLFDHCHLCVARVHFTSIYKWTSNQRLKNAYSEYQK